VVLTGDGDDPETAALRKEMAALVNRCLEALPSPQDRLVIVSRVLEGLKLREVAETLGCSLRKRQTVAKKSGKNDEGMYGKTRLVNGLIVSGQWSIARGR